MNSLVIGTPHQTLFGW